MRYIWWRIADTQVEISQKRASLSKIAIKAKCGSVDDFYTKYNASKASQNEYMKKYKAWEDKYGSGEDTSTPKDEPKGKEPPEKMFFASPFWKKLQSKNGQPCMSQKDKVARIPGTHGAGMNPLQTGYLYQR